MSAFTPDIYNTCISCWRVEIKFSPASIHKFLTNIFFCPSSIYRGKITTTSGYPQKGKKSANGETWPKKAWPSHSMPGQARQSGQAGRQRNLRNKTNILQLLLWIWGLNVFGPPRSVRFQVSFFDSCCQMLKGSPSSSHSSWNLKQVTHEKSRSRSRRLE